MTALLRCRARILLLVVTAAALTACGSDRATNQLGYPTGAGPQAPDLSLEKALAMYVIVPAAIFGLVALLVWLPGMIRGTGYRPGRGWSSPPVWFAGPVDPAKAVESATPGGMQRGGASGSW